MASNASVFNMDNFTVTRVPVPDPGGDSSVPAINQGSGSGSRITGTGFLSAPNLKPGQDQVLVHAGDQSTLLDQQRLVYVTGKETYQNHGEVMHIADDKFTHIVDKEFKEQHNDTTTGIYKGMYTVSYYRELKSNEFYTQTRVRNLTETIHMTGNSWNTQNGHRASWQTGINVAGSTPFRGTSVIGMDLKTTVSDIGVTGVKHSTAAVDGKIAFFDLKTGIARLDAKAVELNAKAMLVRVGALCLKAAAACIGNIRW